MVQHPADAKLVFDDAEDGTPRGVEHRQDGLTRGDEGVEHAPELGFTVEVERHADSAAASRQRSFLGPVAQHHECVADAEGRVHHELTSGRGAALVDITETLQSLRAGSERLAVQGYRTLRMAAEDEIVPYRAD